MRYIDSGRRNPDQALGTWLSETTQDPAVIELRWQTGFFGADGLGHLAPLIFRLRGTDHVIRLLIGSNDGVTRRVDIEALLDLVGPPRPGLGIGIVSFGNGYFHPKVIHLRRNDNSMAAYVGSANLTRSGVSSLHIEAGITMDTRDGDGSGILNQIADAVDWWFEEPHNGFFRVDDHSDVDSLVVNSILGVQRPPSSRSPGSGGKTAPTLPDLTPLIQVPSITLLSEGEPTDLNLSETDESLESEPPTVVVVEEKWSKKLTASDAQRKATGNQRGSITLVQNRYPINAQTYFRYEFFGAAPWVANQTRTGAAIESAIVPILVSIIGLNLGIQDIQITHAPGRESGQGNYTSLVHLGPLAPYFSAENLTGRQFTIERRSDGTFSLTIE